MAKIILLLSIFLLIGIYSSTAWVKPPGPGCDGKCVIHHGVIIVVNIMSAVLISGKVPVCLCSIGYGQEDNEE